jgi:GT2 family glycosyltransferase
MGGPLISVVIPTRGRPQGISRCLAALGRTTLEADQVELIVIGDGLAVRPPPAVAGDSIPVVWCKQPWLGPAAARNAGARLARAPVLAFTDDDCAPAADWAANMVSRVSDTPQALIGGRVRNGLPDNRWSEASHLILDVFTDLCNGRAAAPGFAPTSNLAMRREVFEELGGFDERFRTAACEDRDFCDRAYRAGHELVLAPDAVVDHVHDFGLRELLRQQSRYGRGEERYRAIAVSSGRVPDVVRPRRFFPALFAAAFRRGRKTRIDLLLRVGPSQLAFMVGFFLSSLDNEP